MVAPVLDVAAWAGQSFGTCDLGDVRRTRRAVRLARQMAEHPAGSTPAQTETWGDLKAAYRLVDQEEVTFAALARPHWRQTCARARGLVLVIGDTTELDFGIHRQVEGLGPTGDGFGRGFFPHNALMVDPVSRQILGLAGQELFYRCPAPKGMNSYQASQRQGKESEGWGRLIERIGPPADGVRYLHTFDRGADNLDVFCQLLQQRGDWVIRAAQLHRKVFPAGTDDAALAMPRALSDVLAVQPVLGRYELPVRATKNIPARTALLEVRATRVTIPAPTKRRTPLQRDTQFTGLAQWVGENESDDDPARFLPPTFLNELGMPRPSAVEHYLKQPHHRQSRPSDKANEPTLPLMKESRTRMQAAQLWSPTDTFLSQPLVQNVLKELGESHPAQLCDDLLATVLKRLRTID